MLVNWKVLGFVIFPEYDPYFVLKQEAIFDIRL